MRENSDQSISMDCCPYCGSVDIGPCYFECGSVAIRCACCEAMGPVMRVNNEQSASIAWSIINDERQEVKP